MNIEAWLARNVDRPLVQVAIPPSLMPLIHSVVSTQGFALKPVTSEAQIPGLMVVPVPLAVRVLPCPDCRTGKHAACCGDSWDEQLDELVDCPCHARGHRYLGGQWQPPR